MRIRLEKPNCLDGIYMDKNPASILAEILQISKEMQTHAENNEWASVTELESNRRAALESCFSQPIPEDQSTLFSEALAAMLHMNEELISMLESAKKDVAIRRTDQQRVSRSIGHYLDVKKN